MKKQITIPKFDIYVVIFLFVLCFFIFVFPVNRLNNFYVFGDEFAMYSIGAWLNRLDWSGVTGKIDYYSFGYPLIFIAPLFTIFNNFHSIYKASIIINCILASTLVPLSYLIARAWGMKSFEERKGGILEILAVVLSSCVIVYSTLGLSEVFLIVLFFAITYIIISISNYGVSDCTITLLSLLGVYIFWVHQRALGIMISVFSTVILMFIKEKISKKQLQIYICFTVVFLLLGLFLKNYIQNGLWSEGNPAANDFGDAYGKVISIFTKKSIFFSYCKTVIGQFFYVGLASFGLIYYGVYYIITLQYQKIKMHIKIDVDLIFVLMSFISTFAISTIFMSQPKRADHFFYGRYNDIAYMVFILYTFRNLPNIRLNKKLKIFFFEIIISLVSYWIFKKNYSNMVLFIFNVPNLSIFSKYTGIGELLFLFVYFLVSGYWVFFCQREKKVASIIGLTIIIIFSYQSARITNFDIWNNQKANQMEKISQVMDESDKIYFLSSEDFEEIRAAAYFQTEFLKNKIEQYKAGEEGYLIIGKQNICKTDATQIGKKYVGETDECYIFLVDNKEKHFNLLDSEVMKSEFNDNKFSSSFEQGFLFYGPYFDLDSGNYVASVTLKLVDALNEDVGFIDIVSAKGQEAIERIEVKKVDFINGEKTFVIPFTLAEDVSNAEIRMYVNKGIKLTAKSLFIEEMR